MDGPRSNGLSSPPSAQELRARPLRRSERIDWLIEAVVQMLLGPILRLCTAIEQDACSADALLIGIQRRRLRALLQGNRCVVEETARHHDGPVSWQQPFGLVVLDRSHAFLQRGVLDRESKDTAVGAFLLLRAAV